MKRLSLLVVMSCLSLFVRTDAYAQVILGQKEDISVSDKDVGYYIQENVPQERRESLMAKDTAFFDLVESLYVIRYLAKEAESVANIDKDYAAWSAQMKYQRQLVSQYRVDFIQSTLGDTDWDALALEAYKAEPELYMTEAKIRASHILIKQKEEEGDDEALLLAQQLREEALAGGDFAELATKNTEDPAGKGNGGDLGFFSRGRMVPEFENAAFELKNPGDVSEVVKSPFGYHIIKLVDRKAPEKIPYDRVKEKLIDELQIKLGNRLWQDKVIAVRSGFRSHIDAAELEKFSADYQASKPEK